MAFKAKDDNIFAKTEWLWLNLSLASCIACFMAVNDKKPDKSRKLKSALRDNLKKRKAQARKLGSEDAGSQFAVKLRERDLTKPEE